MDPSSSEQNQQSKLSRIDDFATKLAARHSTDCLQTMSSSGEMGFCIECGDEGFCTDGLCYNCKGSTSGANQLLFPNTPLTGANCSICKRNIPNPKTARSCVLCKKFAHLECCPRSLSILEEYKCNSCFQLPLVFDAMLSSQQPTSPLVNVSQVEQPLEVFGTTSRNSDLQEIPEDLYHLPAPVTHQSGEETQSCDEAAAASPATESDSARNSPFYQPPSDDEEEFKPPGFRTYVPRGRGRGRGSRGKKPGGRGSSLIGPGGIDLMKTRSGGMPPSGHYMDKITQGTRGKRGKGSRGAYGSRGQGKGTRGRRSRGQLACVATSANVLQHLQSIQYSTTREVDEQLIEELEDKTPVELEYVRTAVVYAADDEFMEKAPLCLICGSIGKGEERSFVCCANCAQAYHTFCVGLHEKIRDTIVNRGWRCLDCTICEGCGDGKDDSKLLLCDECDTAYHIYCLDPPLQSIPTGSWRCKYCLRCRRCDLRVNDCSELTREGLCRGCYSLRKCPKCTKLYQIGDQIIRCASCTRWFHGTCEGLFSAEDMENAAANKMRCSSCRPSSRGLFTQTYGSHGQMIVVDNVILHKEAEEILKSQYMPPQYRPDHGNSFALNRSSSFDFWSNIEDDYQEEIVEVTSGRGRGRGGSRGRMLRLGVGGFVVRNPKIKTVLEEEDSEEKRMKKPRKPRRTFLEDAYPPNIQEGFFGVPGLEGKQLIDVQVDEPILRECTTSGQPLKTEGGMLSAEQTLQLQNNIEEEGVLENIDFHEMSDLEGIDFSGFLDDDDDMDGVEDGQPMSEDLRDAFDLVRTDGFDPMISHGTDSNSSTDAQARADANNGITQASSSGFSARPIGAAGELTRSSSQMEMSTAEKNNVATERWEEDEPLGDRATKAAVLYVNINFPTLKVKVPEWNERVKHIQKLWRTLSSDDRKKYVEKARENRQLRGKIPRQRKVHANQMSSIDGLSHPGQPTDGSLGSNEPLQQPMPGTTHPQGTMTQQGIQSMSQYHQQPSMGYGNFPPGMQKVPEMQPNEGMARPGIRPEIIHHYLMMRDRIVSTENQQNYLEDELGKMKKQKRLLMTKRKQFSRDSDSNSAQTPGSSIHDPTHFSEFHSEMGSPEREIDIAGTIDLNPEEKLQLDQISNGIPMKQKEIEKMKQDMKVQMQAMNEYLSRQGLSREMMESHLQTQQGMGLQARYPPRPTPRFPRSPCLASGKCVYSQILSPDDRAVYECVDDLLSQVSYMCEAPPQNMLKRLLEHKPLGMGLSMMGQGVPSASGIIPGMGGPSSLAHFANDSLLEAPKPKKKRTQVKKTGISSGNNEIDSMIERINCHLRMSEKFSRRALESVQSKGSGHVLEPGLTELPDRLKDQMTSALTAQSNKPNPCPIEGEHFGQTTFTFMDDILQVDGPPKKFLISPGPSMAAFAPVANLQGLANSIPTPCEMEFDELDLLEGASRWDLMRTLVRAIPRRPIDAFLRTSIRQFETSLPPLEQIRSAFFREESEDEEVEICIDVNEKELLKWGEKYKQVGVGRASQELFDQFAKMLNNGQKVEYAIDTPPLSPIYPNDGNGQPSVIEKQEPFAGNFAGAEKCRACEMYMQVPACTQNFSRLGLSPNSDDGADESASFCSMRCYYSFVATKKLPLSPDQLSEAERHVDEETISRLKQISADSFAKIVQGKVKMEQTAAAPILSDCLRLASRESRCSIDEGKKEYCQMLKASDLPNINDPDGGGRNVMKREPEEKGHAIFTAQVHDTFVRVQHFKKQLATHPNKMGVMNMIFPANDNRRCKLCDVLGDAETSIQGRLLNFDLDQWVHVNCALWSAEVFENPQTGALLHVQKAVERAQQVMCHKCGRLGASMQCHKADCQSSFHLPCAKEIVGSKFLKDRTFICSRHHEVTNEVVISGLEAIRRLYIDRDENTLLGKLFEVETKRMVLKLGSLTLHSIGQLLPEHLKTFHNSDYIYPLGYRVSRFFYFPPTSSVDFSPVLYRMEYICQIMEKDKKPWFDVQLRYVANDNQLVEQSVGSGPTPTIAWQPALTLIKSARDRFSQLPQHTKPSVQYLRFFPNALTGEGLFGLKENTITKITESLPGVDTLYTYTFRHGGAPILELPLAENPSGCARTEPRCRTLIKKHRSRPSVSAQTAESTSSSSSTSMSITGRRRTSARYGSTYDQELAAAEFQKMLTASGVGAEWVAAMKFGEPQSNASIYTAYQKMKKEWQNTVYLARSKIQGLGLYAKVDIDMHAMIIEYKGELIRNEVCEVREKRYTAQNRGVYMFRIDDELVVDATMAGGCARYINHSCDPNCSTRIIQAGSSPEDKKIIITANRPIKAHEELTYDYQFELEEETKISCLCGAPNCQKWMN